MGFDYTSLNWVDHDKMYHKPHKTKAASRIEYLTRQAKRVSIFTIYCTVMCGIIIACIFGLKYLFSILN